MKGRKRLIQIKCFYIDAAGNLFSLVQKIYLSTETQVLYCQQIFLPANWCRVSRF